MAASVFANYFRIRNVFFLSFVIIRSKCSKMEDINHENSKIYKDQAIIFSYILEDLYAHETQLHRCTFRGMGTSTTTNNCISRNNTVQSHFTFPSLVKLLDKACSEGDIYDCLKTDPSRKQMLSPVDVDMNKTVDDVCCSLKQCEIVRFSEETQSQTQRRDEAVNTDDSLTSLERWREICLNCSVVTTKIKEADEKHQIRLEVLQNATCTDKTFKGLSCRSLNVLALNILSNEASTKLQNDAKDVIRNCDPGFYVDPVRTFSSLTQELSDSQLSSVSDIFTPQDTDQDRHHGGRSFGIFVLVVVVIISSLVLAWLVRTRLLPKRKTSTFAPNISYSRIDYNDDMLDGYSDGYDDDDDEHSMFERA